MWKILPKILFVERNSAQILPMEGNSTQTPLIQNPFLPSHTVTFEMANRHEVCIELSKGAFEKKYTNSRKKEAVGVIFF